MVTLPFALRRPPEFMVERAKEFTEWGIAMEKFKIKDVEIEDHLEVVRLTVNPH